MLIALIVLLAIVVLYLLALRGRKRHPLLRKIRRWKYAHRGLHGNGVPENSMGAFRLALDSGYGIELDIHLLADGNLGVMHDASLQRTAGVDVTMESLTTEDLCKYRLEGTGETIPTFQQVLDLFDGKAPLIVELKSENNNYAELTAAACKMLDHYKGVYCLESFDPRCIRWLKKNRPDILRGQLAHNTMKEGKGKIPFILRFLMTNLLSNFWNTPDFIAYRYCDRNRLSVKICRKFWKIQGASWTLQSREEFDTAVEEKWIPIFEGFKP